MYNFVTQHKAHKFCATSKCKAHMRTISRFWKVFFFFYYWGDRYETSWVCKIEFKKLFVPDNFSIFLKIVCIRKTPTQSISSRDLHYIFNPLPRTIFFVIWILSFISEIFRKVTFFRILVQKILQNIRSKFEKNSKLRYSNLSPKHTAKMHLFSFDNEW